METSALGRAEWMRFMGCFSVVSIELIHFFHVVDSTYLSLSKMAQRLPKRQEYSDRTQDWIRGIVLRAQYGRADDCRCQWSLSVFADDSHSGSLALSFEQVPDRAGNTDVWAFKYNGPIRCLVPTCWKNTMVMTVCRAFRTGEIYECDCTHGALF